MIQKICCISHFLRYSFSQLPRKSRYQRRFLFPKLKNKSKIGSVKVKSYFNMMCISFLLKQLCAVAVLIQDYFLQYHLESVLVIHLSSIFCFSFCALTYWGLFYNYWTLFEICVVLIITLLCPTKYKTHIFWSYPLFVFRQ